MRFITVTFFRFSFINVNVIYYYRGSRKTEAEETDDGMTTVTPTILVMAIRMRRLRRKLLVT